jgi:cellulose synthase/poly-beta-1,6-N-acetylglucosamine synthase-like glycosyltransferase
MIKENNYLRVGKATDLSGKDFKLYRYLEMLPGLFSILTLVVLFALSYFKPVFVAYFIIAFDVYWLLLVVYMAIFLITSYLNLKKGLKTNWQERCLNLASGNFNQEKVGDKSLAKSGLKWDELWHLVVLPTYNEDINIIKNTLKAIADDPFPNKRMIIALGFEERAGEVVYERAEAIKKEFGDIFHRLAIVFHPDNIEGELKGKGANQGWCVKQVKRDIIDKEGFDTSKILVSVFDMDTVVRSGYFFALTHKFLTVNNPYRTSYQPIPVYHNNVWNAPFFSRVAASSNTFWQMIMQVREESLVTYSSHSMTYKALSEIGFWSPKSVSEDSRIFWHLLLHYNGDYRVEPIHFDVSMDATYAGSVPKTAVSLYKQQRRWAWGVENIPYLLFNVIKKWRTPGFKRKRLAGHIFIQVYGFHAWATNALIIALVGWMPMILGGDRFNQTVLSSNLPAVTQNLMNFAMVGLVLSAIISALLLPKRPRKYSIFKNVLITLEWLLIPVVIIIFGSFPCLDAQIRLLRGKYMGFWVTPKVRTD